MADSRHVGQHPDSARARPYSSFSATPNPQSRKPGRRGITASEKYFVKTVQMEVGRRRNDHKWMGDHYRVLDKFLRSLTCGAAALSTALVHIVPQQPLMGATGVVPTYNATGGIGQVGRMGHGEQFGELVNIIGGINGIHWIAMSSTMTAAFALAVNSRLRCKERSQVHATSSDLWRDIDCLINAYHRGDKRSYRQRDRHIHSIRDHYEAALKSSPTVPTWSLCNCYKSRPKTETNDNGSDVERDDCSEASEPEDFEGTRDNFTHAQVEMLLRRYAQLHLASDLCDKLAEWFHTLSSTIGSIAGALAIMALACQALSFSGQAPAWCSLAGSIGNMGMLGLTVSESAGGYDDSSKKLHLCRSDFGPLSVELLQCVYTQPHIQPRRTANDLNKKAESLFTHWSKSSNGLSELLDVGLKCNKGEEKVKKILEEALETYRHVHEGYQPPIIEVQNEVGSDAVNSVGDLSYEQEPKSIVTPLFKSCDTPSVGATSLSQPLRVSLTPTILEVENEVGSDAVNSVGCISDLAEVEDLSYEQEPKSIVTPLSKSCDAPSTGATSLSQPLRVSLTPSKVNPRDTTPARKVKGSYSRQTICFGSTVGSTVRDISEDLSAADAP